MNKINVILTHHTPISCMDRGVGMCWDKQKDTVDTERLNRVINKNKHGSVSEHVSFNFEIYGISRLCLQELARHRMASLSVKSTRYTLKELKGEEPFIYKETDEAIRLSDGSQPVYMARDRAYKYIVSSNDGFVDDMSIHALENLRLAVAEGISNDKVKYCLPEAYRTSLAWTINYRSLCNFLMLRLSSSAHFEIRHLAMLVFDCLPREFKELIGQNETVGIKDSVCQYLADFTYLQEPDTCQDITE